MTWATSMPPIDSPIHGFQSIVTYISCYQRAFGEYFYIDANSFGESLLTYQITFTMACASDEKSFNGTDETTTATFLRSSLDPDVTIIVGDKTYHEYGQSLRCWSSYFDRALASGMKEQKTSQFEFSDRDPKQWEWIVSLMAPMTKERISVETVSVAVDWFDFLCSDLGLEACGKVLEEYVNCDDYISPEKLGRAMAHVGTAVKINLPKAKAACFSVIRECLVDHAIYFIKSHLETITALIKDDVDCRDQLLGPLKTHLPSSMSEEQVDFLIAGDMLHEIINLQLEHLKTKEAGAAILQRLTGRPRNVQHDVATKTIGFDGFSTAGAPNLLTTKGVLYYELEVLRNDVCPQFGFAKKDGVVLSNEQVNKGTGDNCTSWALDARRGLKWHGGRDGEWTGSWEVGTVLGFAANIDKGMIAISKDGDWISQDGFGVVFTDASIQEGVFPCFTGQTSELKYCLDRGSFKYGPPAYAIWEEASKPEEKKTKFRNN